MANDLYGFFSYQFLLDIIDRVIYNFVLMKRIGRTIFLVLLWLPILARGEEPSKTHFPDVGGELFYVDDSEGFVEFYQLIPIGNDKEKKRFISYLATILRDENATVLGGTTVLETMVSFITFDGDNLTYAFISSKSKDLIVKEPYKIPGSDDVWFEMETIKTDENEFVSLWLFKRKIDDDFRINLKISEVVRLEVGKYTLLPEMFKMGDEYNEVHGQFKIIAFPSTKRILSNSYRSPAAGSLSSPPCSAKPWANAGRSPERDC